MFLAASIVVFVVYFSNVALGAFAGNAFLGDVGEMLVLFVAVILFVVAILQKEAERKRKNDS
jgi:Mn2+/Fe2+ NRAMP family transporter